MSAALIAFVPDSLCDVFNLTIKIHAHHTKSGGYVNLLRSISSKSVLETVAGLRLLSQPFKNRLTGIAPRSVNDYATHIPILVGISRRFRIRRVLELGCGDFSTATLLNREVFSDLVQLHSYETDPAWLEKTASVFHGDDRFQLQLIPGSMSSALRETKVETFDMIFVDNSTSAVERAETIRQLVTRSVPNQLIVIHDFEVKDYRDAASTFEHKQIFRAFTPQTAVVWNGLRHQLEILKKLSRQITQESKNIAVDDVIGWRRVLREE